jgi:hypothetical protein
MRNAISLIFVMMIAVPLFAYEYPLSDTSIREAYFLGAARSGKTANCLAEYSHAVPMPKSGPHVASVTVETPYAQVVEYSSTAINLSAVDAEQQFLNKPALVRVRVQIDLTATYAPIVSSDANGARLRSPDFWRDFRIKLLQGKKEIPAQSVEGSPIYVANDVEGGSSLSGAIVKLEYSAHKIASDSTTIEVLTPDGQDVQTEFDLMKLR